MEEAKITRELILIEGIFSIIVAIFEAVISLIGALIEAVAGLFAAGGEALSAGEAIGTFLALIMEVIFWGVLWLIELVISLFTWRKPKKVKKPVIWRSKKSSKNEGSDGQST